MDSSTPAGRYSRNEDECKIVIQGLSSLSSGTVEQMAAFGVLNILPGRRRDRHRTRVVTAET